MAEYFHGGTAISILADRFRRKRQQDQENRMMMLELMKSGFQPKATDPVSQPDMSGLRPRPSAGGGIMGKLRDVIGGKPEALDPTSWEAAPYHPQTTSRANVKTQAETAMEQAKLASYTNLKIAEWEKQLELDSLRIDQQRVNTESRRVSNENYYNMSQLRNDASWRRIEQDLRDRGLKIKAEQVAYDQKTGQFYITQDPDTVYILDVEKGGMPLVMSKPHAEQRRLLTRMDLLIREVQSHLDIGNKDEATALMKDFNELRTELDNLAGDQSEDPLDRAQRETNDEGDDEGDDVSPPPEPRVDEDDVGDGLSDNDTVRNKQIEYGIYSLPRRATSAKQVGGKSRRVVLRVDTKVSNEAFNKILPDELGRMKNSRIKFERVRPYRRLWYDVLKALQQDPVDLNVLNSVKDSANLMAWGKMVKEIDRILVSLRR